MKISSLHPIVNGLAILLPSLLHEGTAMAGACPAPTFTLAGTFGTGTNPASVAVSDFNGDGKPDLVVANSAVSGGTANVSVLLGKGDGTFQSAVNYRTESGSSCVAVGDFNRDALPDLAVANAGSTNVSVLLGKGDGSFQTATNYGATDTSQFVIVGDFDRNGMADLALVNRVSSKVSVLLGRGDGAFLTAISYDVGTDPLAVAVGNFDGNLNPDLAVVNSALFDNLPSISVLLGNGNGTFKAAVNQNVGSSPRSLAVGDFNTDGKLDLAVAEYGSFVNNQYTNSAVSVLLGNGNGSFHSPVKYVAGEGPLAVVADDFNGDGRLDLAVANNRSRNVSILWGKGDGTFDAPVNFDAGVNPRALAVGDFNSDGQLDLAVVNDGGVSVLLNTCPSDAIDLAIGLSATAVAVSWPFPSSTFVLESTTGLSQANWIPAGSPLTNNGRLEVTVPFSQGERYFRLRKQ
jgi:hypothetical protein